VFPQWAVTEAVLHFHVPCNAGNSLTSWVVMIIMDLGHSDHTHLFFICLTRGRF
jgi:hypothetical protein